MDRNWSNFLKNQGEWHGSFTQVSPLGDIGHSTVSILNIDVAPDQTSALFRLRRFASGNINDEPSQDYSQPYTTIGRQNCFFEPGSFSKGSLQLAPYSEFGAEYGFVHQDRRARLVQLFDGEGLPSSLTLIRECRAGSGAPEQPALTIAQLVGIWQGRAETVFADWQPLQQTHTRLEIRQINEQELEQQLSFGDGQSGATQVRSTAKIVGGNRLVFSGTDSTPDGREMLLLPDGISSHIPSRLPRRQPFFVEAGWLFAPNRRQRLIRNYDASGAWLSATLVEEEKMG